MALILRADERPMLPFRGGVPPLLEPGHELAAAVASSRPSIGHVAAATGRIELTDHPTLEWVGAGFLAGAGLVITTGHIADLFVGAGARRMLRHGPVFRMGDRLGGGPVYEIVACLNRHPVLDLAVVELDPLPDAEPLVLDAGSVVEPSEPVGVVAYFAQDLRNDPAWVIEHGAFEIGEKFFSPGRVLGHSSDRYHERGSWSILHDCSTLGGAAGGALIALKGGRVIGCHFAGRFGQENYAVPVSEFAIDPRLRALGLNFAEGAPGPDPTAFEAEYSDAPTPAAWSPSQSSDYAMSASGRIPEVGLHRIHQQLKARFPNLDDALDFLRQHGSAYAEAIELLPGRGRVSEDEYGFALLASLNRRGLLDASLLAAVMPAEETTAEREAVPDAKGARGSLSAEAVEALTDVLQREPPVPFAIGSPFVGRLVRPDGTVDTLPNTIRRLAASSESTDAAALAWLLRAVRERVDPAAFPVATAALKELDEQVVPELSRGRLEPDLLETVDISFFSSGLEAARAVCIVRMVEGERAGGSTGWLLAPDLVIAPAHILMRYFGGSRFNGLTPTDGVDLNRFRVEFDSVNSKRPKVEVGVTEIASLDYSTDLMLLRLTEPLTDRRPLQIDLSRLARGPVATIHYPGLGAKAFSYVGGQILENDGHEVRYVLATTRGSAGAPVFTQRWKVIATHRARLDAIDESGVGFRAKLGTSVEALVGSLRSSIDKEALWRRICGAQEALRSVDPSLLALERGQRKPALVTVVDESTTLPTIRGLKVLSRSGEYLSVLISGSAARKLAATPNVVSVSTGGRASRTECRRSLPFIGVEADRRGIEETGEEAIVALIDDGIDPYHRAFLDEEGKSRIDVYWNQRDSTVAAHQLAKTVSDDAADLVARLNVRGGAFYLGSDLPALGEAERAALRSGVVHGTAVASIAAGRATGLHDRHFPGGIAPNARLIVVRFDSGGVSIGASAGHIKALDMIEARARDLARPVVVNISNGMNSGAHDGTSPVERRCARFLEEPNRAIVKSAGNERGEGRHARFNIVDRSTKVLRWSSQPKKDAPPGGDDELELWFGTHNTYDFVLEDPNKQRTAVFPYRQPWSEQISTLNTLYVHYEHIATTNPLKSRLSLRVAPGKKKNVQPDEWKLIVRADQFIAADTFDAWLEERQHRVLSFKADVDAHFTITIPGTGTDVITVGAIEPTEERLLFDQGSLGPNTRGDIKPDIVAPGIGIAAAQAGTDADAMIDHPLSGTSFAAPHVSGAIALAFSIAHKAGVALRHLEIRALLINASPDVNPAGSFERGHGSLDVRTFLDAVRKRIK
jgi:subtilisin family serine protease/V8-like Glu-specific endopeptidase